MLICSAKSECRTIAATPASSSRRTPSTVRDSGEAEATKGFLSGRPRYVVFRSAVMVRPRFWPFGLPLLDDENRAVRVVGHAVGNAPKQNRLEIA